MLGITAAHHGHRVHFATATDWVARPTDAHRSARLPQELAKLRRYGLIIVDLCRDRDYAEEPFVASASSRRNGEPFVRGDQPWARAVRMAYATSEGSTGFVGSCIQLPG